MKGFSGAEPGDRSIDLVATVQDVACLFREPLRRKGLSLERQIDPELTAVWRGDGVRLRQILINLVSNAVKFTERGGILIHVERLEDHQEKALFKITVCDTGIGVPLEAQRKIFDPFAQADGSMTRRYGGTGLGLAIVQRLVSLMGGDVGLTSFPGNGSTFWFTVSLEKVSVSERDGLESKQADRYSMYDVVINRSHDKSPGARSSKPRLPARILLAEDNAANQEVFLRMLELCGESALEQRQYDLVLMDCEMPEMDGLTATAEIRRREFTRGDGRPVTILALSGYAVSTVGGACLAGGMDGFLPKPVGLKEIQKRSVNGCRPSVPAPPERHGQQRERASCMSSDLGRSSGNLRGLVIDDNSRPTRIFERSFNRERRHRLWMKRASLFWGESFQQAQLASSLSAKWTLARQRANGYGVL